MNGYPILTGAYLAGLMQKHRLNPYPGLLLWQITGPQSADVSFHACAIGGLAYDLNPRISQPLYFKPSTKPGQPDWVFVGSDASPFPATVAVIAERRLNGLFGRSQVLAIELGFDLLYNLDRDPLSALELLQRGLLTCEREDDPAFWAAFTEGLIAAELCKAAAAAPTQAPEAVLA